MRGNASLLPIVSAWCTCNYCGSTLSFVRHLPSTFNFEEEKSRELILLIAAEDSEPEAAPPLVCRAE